MAWADWVPCPRLCVGMGAPVPEKGLHAHAKPWAWHPTLLVGLNKATLMTYRTDAVSYEPLRRWEIAGFVVLAFAVLIFAWVVVVRSAYMQRRMTDAGVYFRAAWAARSGHDLYTVEDANH